MSVDAPVERTKDGVLAPLPAEDVVAFLTFFRYCALDAELWAEGFEGIPEFRLAVTRHEKVASSTYYELVAGLYPRGGQEPFLRWSVMRCLATLRSQLHDLVQADMGTDEYKKRFKSTPFAHRGGLSGTTARLVAWCNTCGICASLGLLRPKAIANILRLLEAPVECDRPFEGAHCDNVSDENRETLPDQGESVGSRPSPEVNLEVVHISGEPLVTFSVEAFASGAAVKAALEQFVGHGRYVEALLLDDDTLFDDERLAESLVKCSRSHCVLRAVVRDSMPPPECTVAHPEINRDDVEKDRSEEDGVEPEELDSDSVI